MPVFAIDFETYYDKDYSLKKMDVWSYVYHPKFDAYLMSVYGEDFQWVGHPKDFQCWEKLEGALLLAHNAAFDSLVFKRLQEIGVIPSDLGGVRSPSALAPLMSSPSDPLGSSSSAAGGEKIPVPVPSPQQSTNPVFHQSSRDLRWRCTASMAVYLQAPRSLKGACKQLLGIEVDKTTRSKACGQTTGELFENEAMTNYALEDARLCYLLWEKHHHLWPEDEQELASLTFEWGQAGIGVDFQTLEKCIQTLEKQRFDAVQLLPWVDDFNEDTPLSHRQLALACRQAGIPCPASLAMDSPLCEAWEIKYGEQYPWVNAMRIFRRTNMLLSRFYAVRNRAVPNSNTPTLQHSHTSYRFPYGMKYFGAVPGRWSGDSGFNVQNMPRGELFGADLRKCFQPSDGNVFIIADLCQIEPRILAWLIDDVAFLDLVRDGVDIYEAHARATMGYDEPAPLKETDSTMRSLAKARVLGLGYGCGPKKFVSVAKNLGGIEISFAEAKQTVADFRSKNPRISRLWKQLDRAFKRSSGGDYSIELPSGRHLQYFDVHKTDRGYFAARTVRGGRVRSLYGGLLCENLVQATARDLFAWHLLKIHRYLSGRANCPSEPSSVAEGRDLGLPNNQSQITNNPRPIGRVVFHVHDEVIVEVPKEQAEEAKNQILEIMCTTPDWLSGCPVDAEAGIHHHYTK